MSSDVLRLLLFGVLLVHGLGQMLGVMAALGYSKLDDWSSYSWLLSDLLGDPLSRAICFVIFLIPLIGFNVAALALMSWLFPHDWWRPLALISSVTSLVALALYWHAFPKFFPNKIGSIAVNVAILISFLIVDWPTEAAIGY